MGKLDKAWLKGVSNHLNAKTENVLSQEKLKDSIKREILLTLQDTFDKHVLTIPTRYTKFVEELFDFSYGVPRVGMFLQWHLQFKKQLTTELKTNDLKILGHNSNIFRSSDFI